MSRTETPVPRIKVSSLDKLGFQIRFFRPEALPRLAVEESLRDLIQLIQSRIEAARRMLPRMARLPHRNPKASPAGILLAYLDNHGRLGSLLFVVLPMTANGIGARAVGVVL